MKTKVYFTVDTESSMGGAWNHPHRHPVPSPRHVFCQVGQRNYGIPLIVESMAHYGFQATYFVETLATQVLGDTDTAAIFDYLLKSKQDVQLHIHPNYRFYADFRRARAQGRPFQIPEARDNLARFPEEIQMELLLEARDFFRRFAGVDPTVFRAGNYSASRTTLRCLAALGLRIDSSFNPCYPDVSFAGADLQLNRVQKIEGVWEIPITVARTRLPENKVGLKYADCTALAATELHGMLEAAAAGGLEHFVLVFHGCRAVKAKDATYEEIRPNRIVISRLEKLFAYLAKRSDLFEVATLGQAAASPTLLEAAHHAVVPELGFVRAGVRKVVQLVNNSYWV